MSATVSFSSSILLHAHLRIAGRLIARGRTKPRRTLLLNQDRKIPGFRSHQTALRTRFLALSLSLPLFFSPSPPYLARISEEPINLDPVARIMCVATKALTHYLLPPSPLLSVFLSVPWSRVPSSSFFLSVQFPSNFHVCPSGPQQNSNLSYLHISGDGGELPYLRVYTYTHITHTHTHARVCVCVCMYIYIYLYNMYSMAHTCQCIWKSKTDMKIDA